MADQPLLNTYGRLPIAIERGEGIWLLDIKGDRYLDTFTGLAVCGLGHAHPAVSEALAHQSRELTHCSNLFHSPLQHTLAKKLCDLSKMSGVFLTNSGGEANEAAIKLARHYGHQRGIANPTIIVMEHAFHGRTMATLTASGNRKLQAGFEPLLGGFVRVPFNDLEAVENVAASNQNVVAVLVEPIQGEGGVNLADADYLRGLRQLCEHQDWLLMLDEVQSGTGRTGSFFAYEHYGITPDVVTLSQGLGNGFPIGACLARGTAAKVFKPGSHGSTFGGNPLACAAALAVISTLENEHLMARARALGNRIIERLRDRLEGAHYIRDIRGKGLMIGIEMQDPCPELVLLAKTQGLLINITAERVIRLLPALTMTDQEADDMAMRIIRIIKLYTADERERPRR
jgi:acetylornithine/N-succinyldiaminopimelate aminotransferase